MLLKQFLLGLFNSHEPNQTNMRIDKIEIVLNSDQLDAMKSKCEKEAIESLLKEFLLKPELRNYLNDDQSIISNSSTSYELQKIGIRQNKLIIKSL